MNTLPTVDKLSSSEPTASGYMPYKGLMPYEEEDAAFFFGREKWRDTIINNLRANRITVLIGGSGVGKSSVLRAGVVYALQQKASQNREQYGAPKIAVTFFNSWRDEPLPLLRQQIEQDIKAALGPSELEPISSSLPFDQALMEWSQRLGDETGDGKLFVILDQFEEYFLYHNREVEEGAFAAEFSQAVNRPDLPVNFLISLRQDSLYRLDRFKKSIPSLGINQLHLEHLDEDAASDAIRKPVKEFNRRYRQDQLPISVEPALVQLLLDQVRTGRLSFGEKGQGGVELENATSEERPVETPFLQMVMTRLWHEEMAVGSRRLRKETLERLGGATQIVKEHLDARMAELTTEEQDAAAHIFHYLVTPSGTKISQTVDDLVRYVNEEGDGSVRLARSQVESLLENLCQGNSRILRPAATEADIRERYEIFHDVLADAILDWRRRYLEKQKFEAEKAELEENQYKERERLRIEVEKERIKNQKKLLKRQKQATQRWTIALTGVAALALVGWGVFGLLALKAQKDSVIAQNNLSAKQVLVELETTDQLKSLQSALKLGHEAIDRNYAQRATAPALALQQILDRIHLKNQWLLPQNCISTALGRSADGQWLVVGDLNGGVCLWSFQRQAWMPFFRTYDEQIDRIELSENGEIIAISSSSGKISIWNQSGALIQNLPIANIHLSTGRTPEISLSSDGQKIAIISSGRNAVEVWDIATRQREYSSRISRGDGTILKQISRIEFSQNSDQIAITSSENITIWDLQKSYLKSWRTGDLGYILALSFSPDGKQLATSSTKITPRLWSLDEKENQFGKLLWRFKGHRSNVLSIIFSNDGKQIMTGDADGITRVWEIKEPQTSQEEMEWSERLKLSGQDSFILTASFSLDDQKLATMTQLGTVNLWSLREKEPNIFPDIPDDSRENIRALTQVSLSPDQKYWATTSLDNTARLWTLQGSMLAKYPTKSGIGRSRFQVFFSQPDTEQIATISASGIAEVWDIAGKRQHTLFEGKGLEMAVGFDFQSQNPQLVTTTTKPGEVRVWKVTENQLAYPKSYSLGNTNREFIVTDFSPDGRYLAIGFIDGEIYLLNLESHQVKKFNLQSESRISSIDFSLKGQRLMTASWDGSATIWNLQGNRIKEIKHGSPIMSARFNSDGTQLVTVSWNSLAKIWDLQGNLLAEYRAETGLWDANFISAPDGQQLVAVGWGARGQRWRIKTLDELLDDGCDWMQDYLTTHPDEVKKFPACKE
jgi:WD40 repeat protein